MLLERCGRSATLVIVTDRRWLFNRCGGSPACSLHAHLLQFVGRQSVSRLPLRRGSDRRGLRPRGGPGGHAPPRPPGGGGVGGGGPPAGGGAGGAGRPATRGGAPRVVNPPPPGGLASSRTPPMPRVSHLNTVEMLHGAPFRPGGNSRVAWARERRL